MFAPKLLPERKAWWANYWPEITDEQSAIDAARRGSTAAFWIAGVTGVAALLALFGVIKFFTPFALLDAALFFGLGILIRRNLSRVAAVCALLLYILEVVSNVASPRPGSSFGAMGILTIIFIVFFITGVRGTFAVRRYRITREVEAAT